MKKVLFISFVCLIIFCPFLRAQNASLLWLKSGRNYSSFTSTRLTTDPRTSDFYMYGSFADTFIYANLTQKSISNGSFQKIDGFNAKLNKDGDVLSFYHFGDTSRPGGSGTGGNRCAAMGEYNVLHRIDMKDINNPVGTGFFSAIANFGMDTLHSIRNNRFLPSFFLAKINSQGNIINLKKEGDGSYGLDIVRDNLNNIYSAYFYFDTSYVNGQSLQFLPCMENGIYILKYNSNNQFIWKLPIMTTYGNVVSPFKMQVGSDNNLYFGGALGRYFDLPNPPPKSPWKIGTKSVPNSERMLGYVAKSDANGLVSWVKTITGPGDAAVNYLVLDASNNIYATGYYTQSATFAPGITLNSSGDRDMFIAKYDKNGTLLWAKSAGGTGIDQAYCIAIDETSNSIFVSGDFYNTATFETSKSVTRVGDKDVFIAWYSLDGTFQKVVRLGGGYRDGDGWCAVSGTLELLVCGYFEDRADFLGQNLQARGKVWPFDKISNFFIAKIKFDSPFVFESLKLMARPCYNGQSYLSWQAVGSSAPCTFYVERSPDGKTWEDLHSTCLQDRQREGILYYTDLLPPPGTVF